MKKDSQIQKDVMDELKWDPQLNAAAIGVAVKDGIVTLSGSVDSYAKKLAAEKDAKKVSGVRAIAEDIQIGVSPSSRKSDTEIANAVLDALKWHAGVRDEKINVNVENGIVRLEGEVEWEYERANAKKAIENLDGVRSIVNLLAIKPKFSTTDIQQKIGAAFQRNAAIDAGKIKVEVSGSRVTLRGTVRSFAEKEDAEIAAWNAPGVVSVTSFLQVEQPEYAFEE